VFQVRVHLAHGEYWTSCLTQQTQVILQIPQKDENVRFGPIMGRPSLGLPDLANHRSQQQVSSLCHHKGMVDTSASMQPLSQVGAQQWDSWIPTKIRSKRDVFLHVFPDDWMVYHSRRPQKIAASQILDHYPQFHNIK